MYPLCTMINIDRFDQFDSGNVFVTGRTESTDYPSVGGYDNTFNGLLSAIFDVYRLKLDDFDIKPQKDFQETLFQPILNVATKGSPFR